MNLLKLFLVFAALTQLAQAVEFRALSCFKGFSPVDQRNNLNACLKQVRDGQKCSANIWEHRNAAFDVCVLEPIGPLKLAQLYQGFSQRDQTANLAACRQQESSGKICITNVWTHGQAVFDVALME